MSTSLCQPRHARDVNQINGAILVRYLEQMFQVAKQGVAASRPWGPAALLARRLLRRTGPMDTVRLDIDKGHCTAASYGTEGLRVLCVDLHRSLTLVNLWWYSGSPPFPVCRFRSFFFKLLYFQFCSLVGCIYSSTFLYRILFICSRFSSPWRCKIFRTSPDNLLYSFFTFQFSQYCTTAGPSKC